ncbi:HET-domain-containing protein [Xylariaceae sp. FL1019]|nr:HET-domain-containing protein [Xylariaceae sp. FL1019]
MRKYNYTPLVPGSDDIRLLNILPGAPNDTIRLEMFHVPLMSQAHSLGQLPWPRLKGITATLDDWRVYETLEGRLVYLDMKTRSTTYDHPDTTKKQEDNKNTAVQHPPTIQYEALSYAWGLANADTTIEIWPRHGHHEGLQPEGCLEIRQNLAQALRYLRRKDDMRTLWIDALCINQEDDQERSEQVVRMHQIYCNASRVVAWLGLEFPDARLAMSTVEYIGKQVEFTRDRVLMARPGCDQPTWGDDEDALLPYDNRTLDAIAQLCSRPWFERLWVLQEMQLASPVSILKCGKHEVDWSLFRRAIMCIIGNVHVADEMRAAMTPVQSLCDAILTLPLRELMIQYADRKCSDDRDRIYGLLNVFPPGLAERIHVSYSKTIGEVFEQMTLARIQQVQRLEFLPECCLNRSLGSTWVCNWSSFRRATTPNDLCCQASSVSGAVTELGTDGALKVAAVSIGSVSSIETLDCRTASDVFRFLKRLGIRKLEETMYQDGVTQLEAHILALTLGHTKERRRDEDFPTLAQLKDSILRFAVTEDTDVDIWTSGDWQRLYHSWLSDTSIFTTGEGYVGVTQTDVHKGDQIFVILGCDMPMVLRPVRPGYYQVVKDCFVTGFMDGEAVLGELPRKCRIEGENTVGGGGSRPVYISKMGIEYHLDPRLMEMDWPSDWEELDFTRARDDPRYCVRFRNINSGEVINSFPQLLPDELRKRGVDVQNIRLI